MYAQTKIRCVQKLYAMYFFHKIIGSIERKFMKFRVQSGRTNADVHVKFRVNLRKSKQTAVHM